MPTSPTTHLRPACCLLLVLLTLPSFAAGSDAGAIAYVYKPDGTRHCRPAPGTTLEAMARELVRHGIAVRGQRKAYDGREGVAVCDDPTGSINVYEISESDLAAALELGFQRIDASALDSR